MPGDVRDFNNIEIRGVVKIFFFTCKARRRRKFRPFWQKQMGNMHHRMPPSKTGSSSLNVVIFPSVMRSVLPGDYWSNSRADLEDRRISSKSIAEQLGNSREPVGSIIHEDLTCGSSPRSGSRNAWTRMKNVNGGSRLSNFWNFFVKRDPHDFLSGAIGNHGRNLVISLWPGDKAKINVVAA